MMWRWVRRQDGVGGILAATVIFSVVWAGLYEISRLFDISHSASAWYPGPGLTLAFLAALGPRYLPCVIIGVYAYDNTFSLTDLMSGARHIIVYGMTGLYLHWTLTFPLHDQLQWNRLMMAACVSTLVSAVLAGITFQSHWTNSSFTDIMVSFWIGDLAGVLLTAPPLLLLASRLMAPPVSEPDHWSPRLSRSTMIGALSVVAFSVFAFSVDSLFVTQGKVWFVVLFPVTVLALRVGFGGAVVGIVVTNIVTVLLFKAFGRTGDPAQLQIFLVMIDAAGLLIGAAISEHKDVNDRLREGEQRQREIASENLMLAAAVHASPISITIIDPTKPGFPIQFVNDAFVALSGHGRSSLRDRPFVDLLASDGMTGVEGLKQLIALGRPGSLTLLMRLANRDVLEDRLTLAPIIGDDGAPRAHLLFHEDAKATAHRESIEREREKLVALGQLAGGIAHEINNLLHPIIALADDGERLIHDGGNLPRRHLTIISQSGRKAADVVRKVLSFARKSDDIRRCVDLVDAVRTAVDLNRRTSPQTLDIRFTWEGAPLIHATDTEVTQIVTNLLLNAAQATEGRGRVTVRVIPDIDGTGENVGLIIGDDGPGIPEELKNRIFEPFFTTKPLGQGTGLGLSVVYGIVKDLGGEIRVGASPDRGAAFTVVFPNARPGAPRGNVR